MKIKKGIIWIGTSDGLSSWNPKNQQLVTSTTENGLPSDAVYAIVGDEQDNLWISTNAGISQYNRSSHKFINYFVKASISVIILINIKLIFVRTCYLLRDLLCFTSALT